MPNVALPDLGGSTDQAVVSEPLASHTPRLRRYYVGGIVFSGVVPPGKLVDVAMQMLV